MSALRHLPPQPTPLLRFLACERPSPLKILQKCVCRLRTLQLSTPMHVSWTFVVLRERQAIVQRATWLGRRVLCDTIIGKPVHSFQSSSDDARPTYSSWMVAAMMAATPIQLPVRVRHHISPLCACWRPQWLLPSSPFFTQRRCLQHVLFGCRSSTLIIFTPRGWWGDRTVPVPE